MKKNVYYLMTCYHLTGDSDVKFFASKDQMHRAYEAVVNPILKALTTHNLLDEEDDLWNYTNSNNPNDTTWGGFRLNGGQNEMMDDLFTADGVNVYYQWGIVEVEITTDQLYYVVRFSEYVDESTIEFVQGLPLTHSKYNEYVTEHLDIARMHEGWTIDRDDKTTWKSEERGDDLFIENEEMNDAYFGYMDVSETIRWGKVAFDPTIILDVTGSMTERRISEHNKDLHNIFGGEKKKPEVTVHIANNPDMDSLAVLLSDPILGVFYNEDEAIKTVKDAMTDEWWNEQDREPADFVTTHQVTGTLPTPTNNMRGRTTEDYSYHNSDGNDW